MQETKNSHIRIRSRSRVKRKHILDVLPIQRTYKRRRRSGIDSVDDAKKTAALLSKMAVAAAVVLIVVLLKSIDTPLTRNVLGHIRNAITSDFDMDDTLGRLKFVGEYVSDVKEVFGHKSPIISSTPENLPATLNIKPNFTVPAEGEVIGYFAKKGSSGNKPNLGIDVKGGKNLSIYSVADGEVIATGENETYGKYLKIDHGNNINTVYAGCSKVYVSIGHKVKQGDCIGEMGQDTSGLYTLHFEVWVNGQPVDPIPLMGVGDKK